MKRLRVIWGLGAMMLGVATGLLIVGADQRLPIALNNLACLILFASAAIRPSSLRKAKP